MAYKSAYKTINKDLRTCIKRTGVKVGETAGYPRVELHSFAEQSPLDKGSAVRVINCVMESITTNSLADAITLNEDNLSLLPSLASTSQDFTILGVNPAGLQELTENADSKEILYRVLQSLDIYIEQS